MGECACRYCEYVKVAIENNERLLIHAKAKVESLEMHLADLRNFQTGFTTLCKMPREPPQ